MPRRQFVVNWRESRTLADGPLAIGRNSAESNGTNCKTFISTSRFFRISSSAHIWNVAVIRSRLMKFFFPDSHDLVDPSFDFQTERRTHYGSRQQSQRYAHEVLDEPPYDGMLLSKAMID